MSILAGILITNPDVQFRNHAFSGASTVGLLLNALMITFVKKLQFAKALNPMLITLWGISIWDKRVPSNANSPIDSKLVGGTEESGYFYYYGYSHL